MTFTVPSGSARAVTVRAVSATATATANFTVTACSVIVATPAIVTETFTGTDGVFASESAFYGSSDLGSSQNALWMVTSGSVNRQAGAGRVTSTNNYFRMWTRQTDLVHTKTEMDVRFNGWY